MSEHQDMEEEDDAPTAPFWMTTFSDMVTLLLTFFVLIVAMSEVEVKKFKEALSHFPGRTSVLMHDAVTPALSQQLVTKEQTQEEKVEQAQRYESLLRHIEEQGLEDKVEVNLTEQGMHIIINDSVMFRSGEATLIEPSKSILQLVSGMVDESVQAVVVEGHTDDRPISTSRFPSNWELSTARASSVVRFLLQQEEALDAERHIAIGYGEHHPLTTNETRAGRSRNRRVEILFSTEPWQSKINSKQVQEVNL